MIEEFIENEKNELFYYKVFCFKCKANSIGFFHQDEMFVLKYKFIYYEYSNI